MSDYHSDHKRVSNSMLSVLKQSPKLFKQQFIDGDFVQSETKSMRLGTLLHAKVLEPDSFDDRFIINPNVDRRTKEGKARWDAFVTEIGTRTIIDVEELLVAARMANALLGHGSVSGWLLQDGLIEKRIDFHWLGVDCRAKPDYFNEHVCLDVKTCVDPSPEGFQRSVFKYGYHRQAAFYSIAISEVYGWRPTFLFACVGNSDPYDVACYQLSRESIEQGQSEIEELLREYKTRKDLNRWLPAWSSGLCVIEKPRWYDANIYETEDVA